MGAGRNGSAYGGVRKTIYYDKILNSFKRKRRKTHTPSFRLRREQRGFRLFDGDTAIAFCGWDFLDIWSFSPFEPFEMANTEPPGKVVDLHTVHNTSINFGSSGWPAHWASSKKMADGASGKLLKWTWTKKRGRELAARISLAFADRERIQWVFRVRYDPSWARYRYTIDIDAWKSAPDGMEPLNMMLAGALAARPEDRRWTHSIWEDPDGKLRRLVHSNALFHGMDYGGDEYGVQWRTRNAPHQGAWIGYAAHESFNPAVLIHRTNVPILYTICWQLFDEHIVWNTAGQENLDQGLFHFEMKTELVNLAPRLAKAFLRRAIDPGKPRKGRQEVVSLPFHLNRVNSFEKPVDIWKPEECPIFILPKADEGAVRWATDAAHTGKHSLRLEGRRSDGREEIFPEGAVCKVRPHRRYRLSGWIKTRGVERFARLELASYEYYFANVIDSACSASVAGSKEWTPVEIELDSGEEAYLMPKLVLYGPGTAWFDDVLLEEVS